MLQSHSSSTCTGKAIGFKYTEMSANDASEKKALAVLTHGEATTLAF